MITILTRQQVFEQSLIADRVVADRQHFDFEQWNDAEPAAVAAIGPFYDHRTALWQQQNDADSFCVLAYDTALSGWSYEQGFAVAVNQFLQVLGIEAVILLQDLAYSWNEFGFNTAEQKTQFLQLLPAATSNHGLLLHPNALEQVLPLLYHNNPDQGRCSLFSVSHSLPLGLLYWKGNLHATFDEKDRPLLIAAAEKAKLVIGDLEVAWQYHFGARLE